MEGKKIKFPNDIIAAITGSIAIIPDGMASAVMAKLNPVQGIYSAVIGLIVGSWTTNSVHMSVTTISALALASGNAIENISENKITTVITFSILVGMVQVILGLFKLGFLVRFISNSVMRGFLTGIALLIIISQVPDFIGNNKKNFQHKVINSFDLLIHPQDWNYLTIIVATSTLIFIVLIEKTKLQNYAIFITLLFVSTVVILFKIPSVQLVGDEYKIPSIVPEFSIPDISLALKLVPSAIAIALIGFVQSVGVSHLVPNPSGDYPRDSKDIMGQGVTNVVCGIATGFPVGGSLAQTALMIKTGAKSRWANFLSGVFAGLLVLLFSKYLELLPMACLASILILTGISSIKLSEIKLVWYTGWKSRLVMLFTFIATLAVSIPIAVLISVIITFILHGVRASHRMLIRGLELKNNNFIEGEIPEKLEPNTIVAIQPYGSLFFAGARVLREKLPDVRSADKSVIIIHMEGREEVGSSFIKVIMKYTEDLNKNNSKLMLVDITKGVYQQLENSGLLKSIGKVNLYRETLEMGKSLRLAWEDANKWIKESK